MKRVLLINKAVGGGHRIYPVGGISTKLYGNATLDYKYGCPSFPMSLEEYERDKFDLIGNTMVGQQWIPIFEEEPEQKPTGAQVGTNKLTHLGVEIELTDYGLNVGGTRMSIDVLCALSSEINPRLWFRLIKREDGVTTLDSRLEPDPPDARLSLPINDVRRIAREAEVSDKGTRAEIVSRLRDKEGKDQA